MIISFFSSFFILFVSILFFCWRWKWHTQHTSYTQWVWIIKFLFLGFIANDERDGVRREQKKKKNKGKRQDAARDDDGDLCDRRIDSTRRFFTHTHVQASLLLVRQFERREKSTRRKGFEDFRFSSLFFGFSQFFIKNQSQSDGERKERFFVTLKNSFHVSEALILIQENWVEWERVGIGRTWTKNWWKIAMTSRTRTVCKTFINVMKFNKQYEKSGINEISFSPLNHDKLHKEEGKLTMRRGETWKTLTHSNSLEFSSLDSLSLTRAVFASLTSNLCCEKCMLRMYLLCLENFPSKIFID